MSREFQFIDRIAEKAGDDPDLEIGIGDDAAVWASEAETQIVACADMLVEGVHFRPDDDLSLVGRKLLAVNLSDVAAMAAVPRYALLTLAIPPGCDADYLIDGLLEIAKEHDVILAGGDTTSSRNGLVVSLTLFGEASEHGVVTRSGARVGDWLFVTGALGGSLLGRHFRFEPRIGEALALHEAFDLHAMIDLSDGLSSDARHLLKPAVKEAEIPAGSDSVAIVRRQRDGSRRLIGGAVANTEARPAEIGIEFYADQIPLHADAVSLSERTGRTAFEHALHDGEDFELLFAVSPAEGEQLLEKSPIETPLTCVGSVMDEPGVWLVQADDSRTALMPSGFEHQW